MLMVGVLKAKRTNDQYLMWPFRPHSELPSLRANRYHPQKLLWGHRLLQIHLRLRPSSQELIMLSRFYPLSKLSICANTAHDLATNPIVTALRINIQNHLTYTPNSVFSIE